MYVKQTSSSAVRGLLVLLFLTLTALGGTTAARADDTVRFDAHDVRTVFYVGKQQNHSEVHYALRLDAACRPVGNTPVFAYWLRRRAAGDQTARLDGMAQRLYGASEQQKVQRSSSGGRVQMHVRALEDVVVDIDIQQGEQGCVAVATTRIAGQRAKLQSALLKVGRFGLSVDYVDIIGSRVADGARVVQRIRS